MLSRALFMSIFMDSEKAPTVQVGAFADIYSAGSPPADVIL